MLNNWFTLLVLLLVTIVLGLSLYLYVSGAFRTVAVRTGAPCFGTIYIAYKFYQSSYDQVKGAINEIKSIATASDAKIIGIYYDNPMQVEPGKQRFLVGIVLNDDNLNIDTKMKRKFANKGFKTEWLPAISHSILVEFPWSTPFSVFLAIWKVYPAIENFIKENKLCAHPYIEFYDREMMQFIVPLSKQERFYVPDYTSLQATDQYYENALKPAKIRATSPKPSFNSDLCHLYRKKNSSSQDKKRI